MTRFRIYTEDKNTKRLRILSKALFDSYTLFKGSGTWRGIDEKSIVFEMIGSSTLERRVLSFARTIKIVNSQQAVLVTRELVETLVI